MMRKIVLILSILTMTAMTALASPVAKEPSEWAKDKITKAMVEKLVPLSFASDYHENITKGDIATLVVALVEKVSGEELPVPSQHPFTDTEEIIIEKAFHAGLIEEKENNLFSTDDLLTREEIVTVYIKAMLLLEEKLGRDLINDKLSWVFADAKDFSAEGRVLASIAAGNGFIKGIGDNKFNPKGFMTREQAIVLNLQAYYYTIDTTPIIEKVEKFHNNVKSTESTIGMYYDLEMEEEGFPIAIKFDLTLDMDTINEPYAARILTLGSIKMSFMGLEEETALLMNQYQVKEGSKLVTYMMEQSGDEEATYSKVIMPFSTIKDEINGADNYLDMDIYSHNVVKGYRVEDNREIVTLGAYIDINDDNIEEAYDLVADMWSNTGLDADMLRYLKHVEVLYDIDVETGAIKSVTMDMTDYLQEIMTSLLAQEGISEEELSGIIDVKEMIYKITFKSFNKIKEIKIPQEMMNKASENVVEF